MIIGYHARMNAMSKRYLAFDIETAKVLPDNVTDLLSHRPLGICCAAAAAQDLSEARIWHGRTPASGKPASLMTRDEARTLVSELRSLVDDGYTLVTWNGLGFDLNILAEESGLLRECADLALRHVDMMFHAVCQLGHFVGLDNAAQGMELPRKTAGMRGSQAPLLWAQGRHSEVIEYNVQDARLALQLAVACERVGALRWLTRKGQIAAMPLERGWLNVSEARRLPPPDTSWMSNPPKREDFFRWFPPDATT